MTIDALHPRVGLAALAAIHLQLAVYLPVAAAQSAPAACLAENGLAYGPFRDGQGPEYQPPIIPRIEQIEEDLAFLSQITTRIRTYSTTDTQANIPHLARRFGIGVAQGIDLTKDEAANERQIAVAVRMAEEGVVESLIVGNEVLSMATLSKDKLIEYLRKVRQLAPPNVPVTTAEVWDIWNSNPDLANAVDFVVAHFYPFWEGEPIERANETLWRNFDRLQATLRAAYPEADLPVVIGETGWPSGGATRRAAVPGPVNQRRFIEEFMATACERSVPFYFFEAFDEEWKWKEGLGSVPARVLPRDRTFAGRWIGSSWGLYRSNGKLKTGLAGLFTQPAPGSRLEKEIFVDGQFLSHYRVGVETSGRQRAWLSHSNGALEMAYPAGQRWGAVFITVGEPTAPPRPWKNFSDFDSIVFELRGERGGEAVAVSIKERGDPDNGREAIVPLSVEREFITYEVPLSRFDSQQLRIPGGLSRLNVVLQFLFSGSTPQKIYARNIRYRMSQ
jgi:exo-beta-1,3-glucanase (GH17 family)